MTAMEDHGKGRPTRSRKEALAGRTRAFGAPVDRKAQRMQLREDRAKSRAGLAAGDERYFPARDKGPVRAYVRDYIDSRFSAGEVFVYFAFFVAIFSLIPSVQVQRIVMMVWSALLALVIADTFYLWFRLRSRLRATFTEGTRGAVQYGMLRALQVRPLRLPKARVKVGGAPKLRS